MEERSPQSHGVRIQDFEPVPQRVLDLLPEGLVRKNLVIPLKKKNGRLIAAAPNTKNIVKPMGLQMVAGCPVDLVSAPLAEITDFIKRHYPSENESKTELSVIQPDQQQETPPDKKPVKKEEKIAVRTDDQLPESVLQLLAEAIKERATEVLVHQKGEVVSVRYRIRGILVPSNKVFSKVAIEKFFEEVRSHGKGSKLDEVEGTEWRASFEENGKSRICEMVLTQTSEVSLLTLRLADQKDSLYNPVAWGMETQHAETLEMLLNLKQGMIVFCGPEKESVSQVFYGSLRKVAKQDLRAMTVEDHITEVFPSADQFSVKTEKKQFTDLLGMCLKHRPDILAVNPVDQKERFDMCFRGGMKGTLFLGRSFALDAADLFYQLTTLDLEPYLVGSALNGVVVQQTIRLLCPKCQIKDSGAREMARDLGIPIALRPPNFYKGNGCKDCGNTGFDKESSIFEVLEMTDDIRTLLAKATNPEHIRAGLKKKGFRTLRQAAIQKAINGQTSLSEVVRITKK